MSFNTIEHEHWTSLRQFSGTSPMINIADALQRMHRAEMLGQVGINLIVTRFLFMLDVPFNLENDSLIVSTYFDTNCNSKLVGTIDFLSVERKLL